MDTYTDEIDLREYIDVLWKWKGLIVAITLVFTIVAGLVSFFALKPVYEASAQIMAPKDPLPAEIITSPGFLQGVIEQLGLRERYDEFNMAKVVSVVPSKISTSLTTIRVREENPALAAEIANLIAEKFLAFVKSKNIEAMSDSVSYFTTEKAAAEQNLSSVRQKLAELKEASRIDALRNEVNRLAGRISSLRDQQASGEMREQELLTGIQELSDTLATTPKVLPGPPDWAGKPTEIPNDTYLRLDQTLALKKVELVEIRARLREIDGTLPAVRADYDERYTTLLAFQDQLTELESEETVLIEHIASFADRISEIATNMPQTNMISSAVVPHNPVSPRKIMNMAVAAVLGGFLSVLAVFGIEYWRAPRKTSGLAQHTLS